MMWMVDDDEAQGEEEYLTCLDAAKHHLKLTSARYIQHVHGQSGSFRPHALASKPRSLPQIEARAAHVNQGPYFDLSESILP